ncbi:hypothetical protein GGI12_005960 [Dipsacomyces acuminosporus]|nr:hypothetical protein GGI12_005960 [Dipsacomyces acuminosporus]
MYMVIYSADPPQHILHISSSVRWALFYEPFELINHSPPHLIADVQHIRELKGLRTLFGGGNVILTTFITKRKDGIPIYVRTISFACSDCNVGVVAVYANNTIGEAYSSELEQQRKQALDRLMDDSQYGYVNGNYCFTGNTEGTSLTGNAFYSMSTDCQACIVVGGMQHSDEIHGPRIVFATSSICTVVYASADEIQDKPFLKMVAIGDILRMSLFLEAALRSTEPVFERLSLIESPLTDSQVGNPKCVAVELMGIRSDYGIMILLQVDSGGSSQSTGRSSSNSSSSNRFLSLKGTIFSDPEASRLPSQWKKIKL